MIISPFQRALGQDAPKKRTFKKYSYRRFPGYVWYLEVGGIFWD